MLELCMQPPHGFAFAIHDGSQGHTHAVRTEHTLQRAGAIASMVDLHGHTRQQTRLTTGGHTQAFVTLARVRGDTLAQASGDFGAQQVHTLRPVHVHQQGASAARSALERRHIARLSGLWRSRRQRCVNLPQSLAQLPCSAGGRLRLKAQRQEAGLRPITYGTGCPSSQTPKFPVLTTCGLGVQTLHEDLMGLASCTAFQQHSNQCFPRLHVPARPQSVTQT